MPQFDSTEREKIDSLRGMMNRGEIIEVYELVKIDWPAPTGAVYYATAPVEELSDPPPPVSPVDVRLIPESLPAWFLPVDVSAGIGDEEIEMAIWDGDGEFSDLIDTHGEGISIEPLLWFPQVELLLPIWQGHLRLEDEAEIDRVPIKAVQGFRSADVDVPGRRHYDECQAVFGGVFDEQAQIDEYAACNYNLQIAGGTVGIVNPSTSLPWTFCDRRTISSCTARGIDTKRHLSHRTTSVRVVNNQTSGPRLYSISRGNETERTEPVIVIMGTRRVYSMPVLIDRRDFTTNTPANGWYVALYEGPEGPIDSFTGAKITVAGKVKSAVPLHYAHIFGQVGQNVLDPQLTSHAYSGTSLIRYAYGFIDPSTVRDGDASASAVVRGLNNIRVYTDATTFTRTYTENRVWHLLEILTNKRWGYGLDHSRFHIPSWIEAADWADDNVRYTDFEGTTWDHVRAQSHVELIGRKVQQQVEDLCIAGRLSLPFIFDGKIHIVPLKALTSDELAAAPLFTDEGDWPNIVFEPGDDDVLRSTLRRQRTSKVDLVNRIECTFDDASKDWAKTTLEPVEDVDLQLAAGRVVGDYSRRRNKKEYALLGVVDKRQAIKVAWSLLDLGPLDRGGIENNLRITFRTWFVNALEIHPFMVIKVTSSQLTRYGFEYFRVMEIRRTPGLEVEIEAQAYNETYMATFETTPPSPPGPIETPPIELPPPCILGFDSAVTYEDGVLNIPIPQCPPEV